MEQFWRKKSFKKLSKHWDEILEQSGFKDIEVDLKEERVLKQNSFNCYKQSCELEVGSKIEYYSLLGNKTYNTDKISEKDKELSLFSYYMFPTEVEQVILCMHAEGALIEEIVQELKNKGQERNRKTIRHIIRRWQVKWGIKSWSLKEMNLKK